MKISVIIPFYQQEKHLSRVCQSVLRQLGPETNLIIVNDDPGNDYSELLTKVLPELDVHLLTNKTHRGVSFSRNRGAQFAIAKFGLNQWLKFLDADDELAPFVLPTFRNIQIPDHIQVVTGVQAKVHNGCFAGMGTGDWRVMKLQNPALVSPTFIRASAFQAVGGFDERIQFEEDWDLWLKLEKKFHLDAFTILNMPICYYWIDDEERAAKVRDHTVEGMDVREYFRKTYGCDPQR